MVLGVPHRVLGALHRVLGVLDRVLGALHRVLGVPHRVRLLHSTWSMRPASVLYHSHWASSMKAQHAEYLVRRPAGVWG